jgi:hypothetical protein
LRVIYLEPGVERPVNYTFEPPLGVPWNTGVLAPQRVTMRNGHRLTATGELSLDVSGFQPIRHRTALALEDFADDDKIRSIYYPEAERALTPMEQLPLALCDARSISPKELIPSDLVYQHMVGETYSFLHNPEVGSIATTNDDSRKIC